MKVALVAVLAFTSIAVAGKPKDGPAKGAAVAFAKAVVNADATNPKPAELAAVLKVTSTPFRMYVLEDDKPRCDATVTEADKRADAIACLRSTAAAILPLKPYTPAILKELWSGLRDRKAEIEKLAKTHALLVHYERGEDVVELAIVAVTTDADGTPRVAAVFAGTLTK